MLPAWIVLPLAGLTLLVTAAHVLAIQNPQVPLRRRRIRTANGLIMMFVIALLAYAIGIAEVVHDPAAAPRETRMFLTVWGAIIGLLGIVVTMAGLDAVHTIRLGVTSRRELRRRLQIDSIDSASNRREATRDAS